MPSFPLIIVSQGALILSFGGAIMAKQSRTTYFSAEDAIRLFWQEDEQSEFVVSVMRRKLNWKILIRSRACVPCVERARVQFSLIKLQHASEVIVFPIIHF